MEWEGNVTAHAPRSTQAAVQPPQPSLLDVLTCDARHTLGLLDQFTVAEQQGNAHAMEILAAAIAVDLRLHTAAEEEVVLPLLRRQTMPGAQHAGDAEMLLHSMERKRLALEADLLEVLTARRAHDFHQLAAAVRMAHQDFAAYCAEQDSQLLPLLAASVADEALRAGGLALHRAKAAARLAPPSIPPLVVSAATAHQEPLLAAPTKASASPRAPVALPDSVEEP
eukprot:scaffold7.g3473.t1